MAKKKGLVLTGPRELAEEADKQPPAIAIIAEKTL